MNIPCENMEIELIYTQLLSNPHTSLAVCAAQEGEGTTSLAFALAERNLLAGHSTLLVDLNLYRPTLKSLLNIDASLKDQLAPTINNVPTIKTHKQHNTLNTALHALSTPHLVTSADESTVLTGVTAPYKREDIMRVRQPGVLEQYIEEWLVQYDTVIIDTSPINRINAQNIPPERAAAACDGAILIVLAGQTPEAAISSAIAKLKNANAQLLGCVLNDRDNPTLKSELLRQVARLYTRFPWLSRHLKRIINKSNFLSLEI